MISTGNTKRYLIWGFTNAIFVIVGFIIGIRWGIPGVAISYAIVNYLLLLPSLYYSFKDSVITVGLFFRTIQYPLIISIVSGVAMFSFRQYFDYLPALQLFFIGLLFSVIIYLSLWCLPKTGREKLKQVYTMRELFMKK
jgi:PST family polysaccharide transporter